MQNWLAILLIGAFNSAGVQFCHLLLPVPNKFIAEISHEKTTNIFRYRGPFILLVFTSYKQKLRSDNPEIDVYWFASAFFINDVKDIHYIHTSDCIPFNNWQRMFEDITEEELEARW